MNTAQKKRISVAIVSIVSSSIILAVKWYAYMLTGSTALKSDALEGIVNVIASFFALGALMFAEQPADDKHPYGHGKIEYFSAAFEGGLISLAAVLIAYEAIQAFLLHPPVKTLGIGLLLNIIAGLLNGLLGWFLIRRGKTLKSDAISADGHHILSDFWTTAGVCLALFCIYLTGWTWLDPLVALIIAGVLIVTGYKLIQKSASALLDAEDPEMIERIIGYVNTHKPKEIITLHEMKAIRAGRYTHVDVHLVVPEHLSVKYAHDLVESFCEQVIVAAHLEGEFHPHVDPCRQAYCAECNIKDCPIRQHPFESLVSITKKSAIAVDKRSL